MIDINNGLNAFLHSLIPAKLQTSLNRNTAMYIRVRALSAMLLASSLLALASGLLLAIKHFFLGPTIYLFDLASLSIFAIFGVQAWFFYRFANYWFSALAFTNIYFVLVVMIVIMSGGYNSPMLSFLLTCPIMCFVIGGMQDGIQNAVFTAIIGITLAALKYISFDLTDYFDIENLYLRFSVSWVTALAIIVCCVMVYDAELQKRS